MVRRGGGLVERAGDRAVVVIGAAVTFDADEVILVARVQWLGELRRVLLLAVLRALDVACGRVVRERRELAEHEQQRREGGGACTAAATHGPTLPQMRRDCT